MHIANHTAILAGIASVLSELGYHRKKAFVLKELTTGLLPALVQARKDGAAEMGVHPAASLASLNAAVKTVSTGSASGGFDESEQGMSNFLSLVCRAYGIEFGESMAPQVDKVRAKASQEPSKTIGTSVEGYGAEAIALQILEHASARYSGSSDLKFDILRSCINVCEALPDLSGALQYAAEMLRVGGSGIAPGPDSSDGSPDISIEEQVRLVNNISRTLSAARQLELEHPEAEYWDDFLIRGIEVVDANISRSLRPHAKSELEVVEAIDAKKEKNPFIYNPFLKSKAATAVEALLVAQEEALFRVTLQNLFDFDVVVERVMLASEGVPLTCEAQPTIIGPYRTQTILLSGVPQASGSLTIFGCTAKIRGCRERTYATFVEPWALKIDVKGRHVGILANQVSTSTDTDVGKRQMQRTPKGPTPSTLDLSILEEQPNVILKASSLPQSAIMLLEGETRIFTITLRNTSRTMLVDLLLLSFDDSTSSQRQSLLSDKEISAIDLYELELSTAYKQTLRWLRKVENRDLRIEPGANILVEIEVLGKPGLSSGTILVDYGHLGVPKEDLKDRFYTRQLVIPLIVTVNAAIKIARSDILGLPDTFFSSKERRQDQDSAKIDDPTAFLSRLSLANISTPRCLLLIDLRNSWSSALSITFEISDSSAPFTHTQSLHPGATDRIPLPLPRLYLANPHAPIPSLNPATKRQFVVSATKSSTKTERTMRETFWYREALLSRLKASWKEESTGRTGSIDLRSLQLTPSMLSSLRLPDLDISLSIASAEPLSPTSSTPNSAELVEQTAPSTYTVPTTTFLSVHTHLHNRSSSPIRPLLRLQPTLAHQPQAAALDLGKKLLVNGLLQRALPTLAPGDKTIVETGFLVLSQGTYEWAASVEEVVAQGVEERGGKKNGGRRRAATGEMEDLGEMGRRTWVAEEPCIVIARDEDGESGVFDDSKDDADDS